MEAVVRRRVAQVIAADEGGGQGRSNESLLAGAMAMALAHVNRQQAAAPAGSKVNHFMAKINNQNPINLQSSVFNCFIRFLQECWCSLQVGTVLLST